jgi:hypothetical protein
MNREEAENANFSLFSPRFLNDLGVLVFNNNAQSRNSTQEGGYQKMISHFVCVVIYGFNSPQTYGIAYLPIHHPYVLRDGGVRSDMSLFFYAKGIMD